MRCSNSANEGRLSYSPRRISSPALACLDGIAVQLSSAHKRRRCGLSRRAGAVRRRVSHPVRTRPQEGPGVAAGRRRVRSGLSMVLAALVITRVLNRSDFYDAIVLADLSSRLPQYVL